MRSCKAYTAIVVCDASTWASRVSDKLHTHTSLRVMHVARQQALSCALREESLKVFVSAIGESLCVCSNCRVFIRHNRRVTPESIASVSIHEKNTSKKILRQHRGLTKRVCPNLPVLNGLCCRFSLRSRNWL